MTSVGLKLFQIYENQSNLIGSSGNDKQQSTKKSVEFGDLYNYI